MVDLTKSYEVDNGITSDGVILPDSIFESTRSLKTTYSSGLISTVEYFNSLIQISANRIAKIDLTYNGDDFVTQQVTTYYENDGTTVYDTETATFTYTDCDIDKVEVS